CEQDKCNVMRADGVYNYYIIADYRYIIGCYQDTPKKSFHRARGERQTRKPSDVGSKLYGKNSQAF
ncbi:MAG: hypothetical protein AAFN08_12650, partial [Cyanobacteria bacterium J06559_3]